MAYEIEIKNEARAALAHLASLGAKIVEDVLGRRRGLAGGGFFAESSEPGQPGLPACRRLDRGHSRQPSYNAPLAGNHYFFAPLCQTDESRQIRLCLFQRRRHNSIKALSWRKSTWRNRSEGQTLDR
jgi:hypothetical protein